MAVKRKTSAVGTTNAPVSEKQSKRIPAIFFRTEAGVEPLREWLKGTPALP